jgi:hypothetical protein
MYGCRNGMRISHKRPNVQGNDVSELNPVFEFLSLSLSKHVCLSLHPLKWLKLSELA